MRLPRDSVGVPIAADTSLRSSSSLISSSLSSCKLLGNKENVQPPEGNGSGGGESSTAANLLWLLDFRLDNLLPNDGNTADKMAHVQGIIPFRWFMIQQKRIQALSNRSLL